MTPLKERILTLIRQAGPNVIDGDNLFALTYADGYRPHGQGIREQRARTVLKAHVAQINKQLASESAWHIAASRCLGGHYTLRRVS
jgi:hypothetical protein